MQSRRVTPEMVHCKALEASADQLERITRECDRLEARFHRLLKDFDTRRATLAAMARSWIDRERAESIDVREVN